MRLRYLLVKELLQGRRDPLLLRMVFVLPLLQTVLLSYAANMDVIRVPLVVWDADRTSQSRELVSKCAAGEAIELHAYRNSVAEIEADLDAARAALGLIIPSGFASDLARGHAVVQVLADGSESTVNSVAAGYLTRLITEHGLQAQRLQSVRRGRAGGLAGVVAEPRVLYNPDMLTLWFMAPAILAMVLTVLMQNITALSIARERELGTLDQLLMSPVKPWEILLAKLLPVGVMGLAAATIVAVVVVAGLGVPFTGSLPAMVLATVLFLFAVLGLGLLVSAVSLNQQQAMLTSFFLTFPAMILSGFIFPVWNLPKLLLPLSNLVPMTHYLVVARGIFLRGSGVADLWPQLLALGGLATLFFVLGALLFTKKPV